MWVGVMSVVSQHFLYLSLFMTSFASKSHQMAVRVSVLDACVVHLIGSGCIFVFTGIIG